MSKWLFIGILIFQINDASGQVYTDLTYDGKGNPHLEITKITITDKYTIVDFIHYNPYAYGGWTHIMPNTFIRTPQTKEKLTLIKAQGIPIAPHRHIYKKVGETLRFRLYFPPINPSTEKLDIIESEGINTDKAFNFYKVRLKPIA